MSSRKSSLVTAVFSFLTCAFAACDMSDQPKYAPYAPLASDPDRSSSRMPLDGTVPYGSWSDVILSTGIRPVKTRRLSEEETAQARRDFVTFCGPCHGDTGDGRGAVVQRGFPESRPLRELVSPLTDPQLFTVIFHGKPPSPAFKASLSVGDTVRLVSYLRAESATTSGGTP